MPKTTVCHANPFIHQTTSVFFLGCLLATTSYANAAPPEPFTGTTVSTRFKPELSPPGIHQGSFFIFPKIGYAVNYDDNILVSDTHKLSGYISVVSPSITALSDWGRHELTVAANADIGRNSVFESEDYEDWYLAVDGVVDINHDRRIKLGIKDEHNHIDRTAPDTVISLNPITYTVNSGYILYSQQMGKLSFNLQLDNAKKDYNDAYAIRQNSVVLLNMDDRDHSDQNTTLRSEYEILPNYKLTAQLLKNYRDYAQLDNKTLNDRSSHGQEIDLGVVFRLDNWFFGEAFLGYRQQNYIEPYPDIHALLYGGSLNWNITGLTSLILESQRSVRDAFSAIFSGYVATRHTLTLEHELRRHLAFSASIGNADFDYEGIKPAERNESLAVHALSMTYVANRNLNFFISYRHLKKSVYDNTQPVTSHEAEINIYTLAIQVLI